MRLVFLLFVVFLVSADAKFSLKLGDLFGKISSEISKLDIPSIAQKIIRGLQPRKPSTEKSAGFCGDHDCPNFYEIKLDSSDYKLRCYPKPYKWVSTTYQGKFLTSSITFQSQPNSNGHCGRRATSWMCPFHLSIDFLSQKVF